MADKVYYQVEATVTIAFPITVTLTVRTENGSDPKKAVIGFCQTGQTQHPQGWIENEEYSLHYPEENFLGCPLSTNPIEPDEEAAILNTIRRLHEDGKIKLSFATIEAIDAK